METCTSCEGTVDSATRPCPHCRPAAKTAETAAKTAGTAEKTYSSDGRPLAEIYRHRRINLKDLPPPLRLLIYLAFGQTVAVALLLLISLTRSQPMITSGVPDQAGGTFLVPTVVFIVMAASLAAGYCLALAGALRVRAAAGLAIVAAMTVILAVVPISTLYAGPAVEPHEWLRWAQLGVLAALWVWVLWHFAARRRGGGSGAGQQSSGGRGQRAMLAGVLAVVVAYYALEAAIWGSYAQAGQAARGTGFLVDNLSFQAVLLPVFLTLVVLLGSTDLLDWGELIVARAAERVRSSREESFLILTPLAACLVIANAVRVHPGEALPELLVGAALAAIVGLLVHLGTGYTGWTDDLRGKFVFAGAVSVFVYTTVFSNITEELATAAGLNPIVSSELYLVISTPVLLVLLTAGLFLVARGRARTGATGLFMAMVGLLTLVVELPVFLSLRSTTTPGTDPWPHFSLLSGIQLAAGIGTLVWVGWLLAHKRLNKDAAGPLLAVFLLLAGLELVSLVIELLHGIDKLGQDSAFALAGLFLLVSLWGLITSGDSLNAEAASADYPRDGRVMLFVGYTLIANATLVYLGTLREPGTGNGPPDFLTADYVSPAGVGILGTALVVMAFIMGRRRSSRSPAAPAGPARTPAAGTIRRSILGVGAVATAAALIFAGAVAAPHLADAGAQLLSQPYHAPVPGPGCDGHGGSWTVPPGDPITTTCLQTTGLQVQESRPGAGDVQFLPPSGTFPRNYRVSVQVDLSHMPDGCASIYTRGSATGFYSTFICTNTLTGASSYVWGIDELGLPKPRTLGSGVIPKAGTYLLQATAANSVQQITVDGSSAAFTDGTLAATRFVSLGISDAGQQGGSVIFSNFTFTPLPAQPGLSSGAALTPFPAASSPSPAASPAPSPAGPAPSPASTAVADWFTGGGQAELDMLSARADAVGAAASTTYAELGQACSALASAVATAQSDPPFPDPTAQVWLAEALDEYGDAAAVCESAAASHSLALVNEAAVPMRAGTADYQQFINLAGQD